MYKVIFKSGIDPTFLDDPKGKIVEEAFLNSKHIKIKVNGSSFYTGDVKAVFMVEKSRAEQAPEHVQQEREYREFRKKMLSLSLEERSKIIRFAKIIWRANSDEEMPEEVKKEIVARQLTYFTKNPACIYANPAIYRDLMPQRRETPTRSGFSSTSGIVGACMMQIISNQIATDLILAKRQV